LLKRVRDLEIKRTTLVEYAAAEDALERWNGESDLPRVRNSRHTMSVQPQVDALAQKEQELRKRLPGYIQMLSGSGYAQRVFYFEIFECARKLLIVCAPVFFVAGSVLQIIFGLIICFITFGFYTMLQPYAEKEDNAFAILTQIIIFISLISSFVLSSESPNGLATKVVDVVLVVLFCVPIFFEIWIDACSFSCKTCTKPLAAMPGGSKNDTPTDPATLFHDMQHLSAPRKSVPGTQVV
jgi:hypothetical protein